MFSEKSSRNEECKVTPEQTADEVRRPLVAAEPKHPLDTQESWLARTAWKLGLDAGRVKRLFYREVRRIPAHEFLTIQARAAALQQRDEHRREYIEETRALAQEKGGFGATLASDIACALSAAADKLEGVKRD